MGVTELARRVDLLPSDVHRILNSLATYGFIEQNPVNKTYRLGIGVMKLGLATFQRNELREAARSVLQRLSEEADATAHLAIFDDVRLKVDIPLRVAHSGEHGIVSGRSILEERDVVACSERCADNRLFDRNMLLQHIDVAARCFKAGDDRRTALGTEQSTCAFHRHVARITSLLHV